MENTTCSLSLGLLKKNAKTYYIRIGEDYYMGNVRKPSEYLYNGGFTEYSIELLHTGELLYDDDNDNDGGDDNVGGYLTNNNILEFFSLHVDKHMAGLTKEQIKTLDSDIEYKKDKIYDSFFLELIEDFEFSIFQHIIKHAPNKEVIMNSLEVLLNDILDCPLYEKDENGYRYDDTEMNLYYDENYNMALGLLNQVLELNILTEAEILTLIYEEEDESLIPSLIKGHFRRQKIKSILD